MSAQQPSQRLWYNRPASHWLEALPIGNSHLGAMVYGETDGETIQLNEETFWSGSPYNNNSLEAKAHLQEVRDSIFGRLMPCWTSISLKGLMACDTCRWAV